MKRLHRLMHPTLEKQLKQQETRIRNCGYTAWVLNRIPKDIEEGTYFSTRPIRR